MGDGAFQPGRGWTQKKECARIGDGKTAEQQGRRLLKGYGCSNGTVVYLGQKG